MDACVRRKSSMWISVAPKKSNSPYLGGPSSHAAEQIKETDFKTDIEAGWLWGSLGGSFLVRL